MLNFRNSYQTLAHVSKYSHQCTHCLKYYFETLLIFVIIKDLGLWSGSVWAGHCDSSPLVRSSLTCKWPDPQCRLKVINYRLIEGISHTLNEWLFLPYCKLYDKCFSKNVWIFPLMILFTMKVIFLKCQIFMFFSLLERQKRSSRIHGKR